MRWKDVPDPALPLFVSQYPRLAERLEKSPEKRARFWFVLEEDKFDLLLDDTVLQYFQGAVFDSEDAARAYIDPLNEGLKKGEGEEEGYKVLYILKSFEARMDGPLIDPVGHEPEENQDYYIERILKRIEETLAADERLPWGTRYPGW